MKHFNLLAIGILSLLLVGCSYNANEATSAVSSQMASDDIVTPSTAEHKLSLCVPSSEQGMYTVDSIANGYGNIFSVTVSAQPSMTSYPPTRSAAKPPSPTTTRTVIHGQATGRRCWPSLQYIPTSTLIATLSLSMPPKCSASKTPFGLCTRSPTRSKK